MNKFRKNLTSQRKNELEELAQWIIDDYFPDEVLVKPETIALAKGIKYTLNFYNNDFKALIECKNSKFHIFLNIQPDENINTTHVRYSFAHELGHYFIYEHHLELMNQGIMPVSNGDVLLTKSIFEKEAEFFASCLLMPRSRVIHDITTELFSIDTVLKVCSKYQVSLSAALSRYMAVSAIPIMVIHTYTDGTFDYHLKSRNFPFYKLNLSPDNIVPVASKAWECCFTSWNDYTSPKVNQAEVWFCPKNENDALRTFNEHCFLQPAIGRVVSVIWEIVS